MARGPLKGDCCCSALVLLVLYRRHNTSAVQKPTLISLPPLWGLWTAEVARGWCSPAFFLRRRSREVALACVCICGVSVRFWRMSYGWDDGSAGLGGGSRS